jgi:hypothetical protein
MVGRAVQSRRNGVASAEKARELGRSAMRRNRGRDRDYESGIALRASLPQARPGILKEREVMHDAEYVHVGSDSRCPYDKRSREVMRRQGNIESCYRLMYHRERDRFYCVPDVGFGKVG